LDSITVLGVRVDDVTMDEALAMTEEWMQEPRLHHIMTVNPEFIMAARKNPEFAAALAESDLNLPDGANLVRAAEQQGTPLRERVAGTDFMWYLCGVAAVSGWPVFMLGGRKGVGGLAAARLQARYPKLKVAGTYEGTPAPQEEADIVERVNASGASILFVAYGAPAQDLWIRRNRAALQNIRAAAGVGGAFDYIARRVPRAPGWMQRIGLEWFFRLLVQPWRIKRQWVLADFTLRMFRQNRGRKKGALRVDS
jgi:N-acetylglucosaminyldiphosphoundecaprenol N-acetyl-beta-D-mannosaminyltransferase